MKIAEFTGSGRIAVTVSTILAVVAAALAATPAAEAAETVVKVATYNAPARFSVASRAADLRVLDRRGVSVVALQENRDSDTRRIKPTGWGHYRPTIARSAAVIWDRSVFTRVHAGHLRIDRASSDTSEPRYIVWVHLRHKATGKVMRYAAAHLVAWPYKTTARANEYAHQIRRVADWINGGPHRIIGMDGNSRPDHARMAPLRRVADVQHRVLGTYQGRVPLDHIWRHDVKPRAHSAYTVRPSHPRDHWMLVAKVAL